MTHLKLDKKNIQKACNKFIINIDIFNLHN